MTRNKARQKSKRNYAVLLQGTSIDRSQSGRSLGAVVLGEWKVHGDATRTPPWPPLARTPLRGALWGKARGQLSRYLPFPRWAMGGTPWIDDTCPEETPKSPGLPILDN